MIYERNASLHGLNLLVVECSAWIITLPIELNGCSIIGGFPKVLPKLFSKGKNFHRAFPF